MVLGLLPLSYSVSQTPQNESVWKEKPGFSLVNGDNEKESVIGIFMDERYEYSYTAEGDLVTTHSMHQRFRLNTDEAVNSFNKLSVSLSDVIEVIEIKARVIKPDGNVIEFDKNNIKEIKDEESGKNFKIFAIDGIEKGDDIEYLIIRKMIGLKFGRTYFQFGYPLQKASFELISPKNLKYAAKGYNGFPDATSLVLEDERNSLNCSHENIPALKDEKYYYYNSRRERLEYKLEYNFSQGKGKVLTWNDASQRIFDLMYRDVNQKTVDNWLKTLRIKDGTSVSKAAQIEEYVKNNIHLEEFNSPELSDLDYIRTRKVSCEQGVVRLYANLFKASGIKHEIVLTSERDQVKFDPDFQSWNYLSKYLIYLPEGDTYIDPADDTYRIGCVDGMLTATYGLFVELVKIGDFESAIGKIKYINPTPFNANYDNMHIEIFLDTDRNETRIIDTRGFKGLSGGFIGRIYKTLDEERKQEILKSLMESKASNPVYSVLKVLESTDIDFIGDADFIIYSDFATTTLLEIAGNKLLFNIGESIGPQVELYHDETIIRGGESDFNRWYHRTISFKVPAGYRIANPDAADMTITEKSEDELIFGFISSHEYSGNNYTITIDEYYKKIFIDPEDYEGFRDVVNAAANFNKVVLVLEKI
jgi:hypothetical protein